MSRFAGCGKRLQDIAISLPAIVVLFPLMIAIVIAIRVDSPGGAMFTQIRVGMHGRTFRILKFRTMRTFEDSRLPDGSLMPNYMRVTRVGRVLRRTSLDELPQLLNVLRGEMSVVGPRPALPYQVERYTPEQRRRLEVRPGLTGLAQVNGRNGLSWPDKIGFDVDYVDKGGLVTDLRILMRTVRVLTTSEGVAFQSVDSISEHNESWLKDVGGSCDG